jgi:serine/threonine protein kinase/tetratricopeptide (TPR) repeat protein
MQEQSLFIEALEKEDPAERAAFLDQACAGDPALRQRIERLLERHEQAGNFLEAPTPAEAPITEGPGTVLGPYKLMEQIGEGGMGLVFVAEQQQPVRRKVALKVIKPGMDTREVIARFEAERQALALMDHPNIAKVHDAGTTGGEPGGVSAGRPYFVMELVKGVPITQYCDDNRLPPRERLELFVSVCQAVQHAHTKGIIHRDVKPSNVLVASHDGTPVVKVIDFGVAKAVGQQLTERTVYTSFSQLLGTPLYMSPEQAGLSSLDIDTRADIYALGVLLYELLTGMTPFDADRLRTVAYDEMRRIIREEEPPTPSRRLSTLGQAAATVSANRQSDPKKLGQFLRGELDWIVMKALEKDRNRRYETASALAADVQRYLKDEPVEAFPPSAWYRLRKFVRRHRPVVWSAAAVLALVLLGGGGAAWWGQQRAAALRDVKAALAQATTAEQLANERLDQVTRERDRADQNLELAHKAVTHYLSSVTEDPLLREADLLPLRKTLLQAAGPYFRDFARQQPTSDPRREASRGEAFLRLAIAQMETEEPENGIRNFHEARAIFARLVQDEPFDARYGRGLCQACYSLAVALRSRRRTVEAVPFIEQAVAVREKVLVHSRDDGDTAALVQNYLLLGHLLRELSRHEEALHVIRRGLALAKEARARHPDRTSHQYSEHQCHLELATHFLHVGQFDQVELEYQRAREIAEGLVKASPKNVRYRDSVPACLHNLAVFYRSTGEYARAVATQEQAVALFEKVVADFPSYPRYRFQWGEAYAALSAYYGQTNQPKEAWETLEKGRQILEKVNADYPANPEYRHKLAVVYSRVGNVQTQRRQWDEAEATLRRACTLLEGLVKEFPLAVSYSLDLGLGYQRLATLFGRRQQYETAHSWYVKAEDQFISALKVDGRNARARSNLGDAYIFHARILSLLERHAEAIEVFDRSLPLIDDYKRHRYQRGRLIHLIRAGDYDYLKVVAAARELLPEPKVKDILFHYDMACLFSLLSAHEKAEAGVREQCAVQAMELLRKARATGFFKVPGWIAHLKQDADLNPLRGREDYKRFVQELEKEAPPERP